MKTKSLVVWAADIGSISRGHFGWCRVYSPHSVNLVASVGQDINDFVTELSNDISAGCHVALGFECPLFIPVTPNPQKLTNGRTGEGSRAWSAQGGSGALTTGLPICVWVFEQLLKLSVVPIEPTFEWETFLTGHANVFVWEAFVSAQSKTPTHTGDAEVAALSFWSRYFNNSMTSDVTATNPYSLVGAALLRAGLTKNTSFISQSCIVIKS